MIEVMLGLHQKSIWYPWMVKSYALNMGVEGQSLVKKLRSKAETGARRPKPSHYGQGIGIRSCTLLAKNIVRLEILAQG